MTTRDVKNSSVRAVALGAILAGLAWTFPAHADEPACVLRGDAVMSRNVSLFDARTGGSEIARFTGGKVALSVIGLPDDGAGRAAVETSGFRIKGFVRARDLPVYTARSVPVFAGHVWIAEARRVAVIGGSGARVRIEKSVASPMVGTFQAWAPCESLTLTPHVPPGFAPSGGARGYLVKKDQIDLYSEPKGDVVTSIEPASDGPGVLLWSDDREGAWVHVEHHSDVTIDAWARAQDLSALPPGETMDELAPGVVQTGSPSLRVQGNTKVVHAPGAVSLRAAASDAASIVGGIDAGTDVLVLDVVAGWASVVPKDLGVAPAGDNQFWARAKDLGL
jgi:hypothetical protein